MKCRIVLVLLMSITTLYIGSTQCPEDPEVGQINTQEKFDFFFENYPNCREFSIRKYNGEFIGDPGYTAYTISLIGCLTGILILLKVVFRKWE